MVPTRGRRWRPEGPAWLWRAAERDCGGGRVGLGSGVPLGTPSPSQPWPGTRQGPAGSPQPPHSHGRSRWVPSAPSQPWLVPLGPLSPSQPWPGTGQGPAGPPQPPHSHGQPRWAPSAPHSHGRSRRKKLLPTMVASHGSAHSK